VAAHTFPGQGAAVTALATSQRIRTFAAGYADGSVRLLHVTSGKELARLRPDGFTAPVTALALAPKDDGLAAISGGRLARWAMDPRHPEATPGALFGPVWYEGAERPAHVWQSSSGTDDFEPKFGLMPLVFGTLKATVFSLLFGVPIALLAAIFTSEFLQPKVRTVVKPLVEMMASLPSVVLGFLAALVFAPLVAGALPAILAAFVFVPAMFLAAAYLWQLAPSHLTLRAQHWRLPLMFLTVPAGLLLAAASGHGIERLCFAGDIMRWLDGQIGGAAGGWAALLYPVTALLTAWAFRAAVNPWLRRRSRSWSRGRCAAADAVKFLAAAALTIPVAAALGAGLAGLGLDPRGCLVGTYVQRNALVVGFVMGFAIIPIIYTLTEDALAAVPDHLRSASLGAGATPWQTAVRIVIPTAMSGIFSAVMIGLGRAAGETMIVLMAAGNTPVMEWNPFNGFRTLSANIAVELPEAVRNSTHYRTLFLAALVLFVMTFILNTIAETVRMRYRRKAVEL
jgi:phosphate transport system permease protein